MSVGPDHETAPVANQAKKKRDRHAESETAPKKVRKSSKAALATDPTTVADTEPVKEKRKKKKRSREVEETEESAGVPEADPSASHRDDSKSSKGKKSKRHKEDAQRRATEVVAEKGLTEEDDLQEIHADERASGQDAQAEAEENPSKSDVKKERKKKRAKEQDILKEVEEQGDVAGKPKKKRKRDNEVAGGQQEKNEEQDEARSESKRPKKKKRKRDAEGIEQQEEDEGRKHKNPKSNKTGFLDPSEDESLSDQARKALEYAFAQVDDPASWKFNKARQNWLIRNVWSEQAILPDYMPLVTHYLAKVKGGVREALVKSCRDILVSSPPTDSTSEQPVTAEGATTAQPSFKDSESKQDRATALLAVLAEET